MKDRINPYRHRVKAVKSEDGWVDYIVTSGLGDPRESKYHKPPLYGLGEHPLEKRLKMLEAKARLSAK